MGPEKRAAFPRAGVADMIYLEIPGQPVAKARPQIYSFRSKSGKVFHHGVTPKKTASYENLIRLLFNQKYPEFTPLVSPLSMTLKIYQEIPKSESEKRKRKMELGEIRPAKRPEIDNVIKGIFDALIGHAYHDDNQIVRVEAEKFYSFRPRVEIFIETTDKEGR